MTTEELAVSREGDVVTVVFDRPHRHNAFTTAMYEGLQEVFADLAADDTARVLVMRGAGGAAFAAGNDIGEFTAMMDADTGARAVAYESRVRDLLLALARLPQVSIAAIDGLCVGGGLAVATYCDLRIATANSRFGYPIARTLGNALSLPLLARCVDVFGDSLTRQMLLTSRLVPADRAYAVGALLDVAADTDALDAELAAVVEGVLLAAPATLITTKRQLGDITGTTSDLEPGVRAREDALLAEVYGGPAFREGVRAFLAKERPSFPPCG